MKKEGGTAKGEQEQARSAGKTPKVAVGRIRTRIYPRRERNQGQPRLSSVFMAIYGGISGADKWVARRPKQRGSPGAGPGRRVALGRLGLGGALAA